MSLGIVTICYNGYGRFLDQWVEHVKKNNPEQITVVALGRKHGIVDPPEGVNIIYKRKLLSMGEARNVAVENTKTDWVLYFSIDDELFPNIRRQIEEAQCDVLSLKYLEERPDTRFIVETPVPTPAKIRNWVNEWVNGGYVAFRRSYWEKVKYPDNEYPNFPFIFGLYAEGAEFRLSNDICAIYKKRPDSHSGKRDDTSIHKAIDIIDSYARRYIPDEVLEASKKEETKSNLIMGWGV